jgi:hypothetical protein
VLVIGTSMRPDSLVEGRQVDFAGHGQFGKAQQR